MSTEHALPDLINEGLVAATATRTVASQPCMVCGGAGKPTARIDFWPGVALAVVIVLVIGVPVARLCNRFCR